MIVKTLNDMQIRNLKPKDSQYRESVDRNLYIEVFPSGTKTWRFRVRGQAGEKDAILTLGRYPAVTLEEARILLQKLNMAVERGVSTDDLKIIINPKAAPKIPTFGDISKPWFEQKALTVKDVTLKDVRSRLDLHILPALGARPVNEIKAGEIFIFLNNIQRSGRLDLAHRLKDIVSGVMRHAVALGHIEFDPCINLKRQLQPARHKHFGSIWDKQGIADLIRKIDSYDSLITKFMMKFSLYVFQRPSEIRFAKWDEFDFTAKIWRIPPTKQGNKRGRVHDVPLSRQALVILEELKSFRDVTGGSEYVFPGRPRSGHSGPMSENTLRKAFLSMGYPVGTMTAHGFRSLASTNLNALGINPELVELQLSHMDEDGVRAAYNFADRLPERIEMMDRWADWLDTLVEQYPATEA